MDHEFRNDGMEDGVFEVSALNATNELFQSKRSLLGEQPDVDVPECRADLRFVGKWLRACALGRSGCCNCPSLSCGTLVENALIRGNGALRVRRPRRRVRVRW